MRKLPKPPKPRTLPKKHRTITKGGPGKRTTAVRENILGHEYSPETGHLTVTFRGGRRYRYEGVGKETADAFSSAESKGRFLNSSIIGKFDESKLSD